MPLPASNLRTNVGTWAVPVCRVPAVAHFMHDALPNETFDPHFLGEEIETTYFDTPGHALRKARVKGTKYLTLRLRCYGGGDGQELYALSAKTESEKWRQEVSDDDAYAILAVPGRLADFLPGNLLARLQALASDTALTGAVKVCCRRYAVEDAQDRYTLDCAVHTDLGKCLPFGALEHKSADIEATEPAALRMLQLRPIKLSKFLWATEV